MQIRLAKTPNDAQRNCLSKGGNFNFFSLLFYSTLTPLQTYAYNALPTASTPYPCISLSHARNTHNKAQREVLKVKRVCVSSDLIPPVLLSCPFLDCDVL